MSTPVLTPSYGGSPDVTPSWVHELAGILQNRDGKPPAVARELASAEHASLTAFCVHWLTTVGAEAVLNIEMVTSRQGRGYRLWSAIDLPGQRLRLRLSQEGSSVLSYTLCLSCGPDGVSITKTVLHGTGRPMSGPFVGKRAGVADLHAIDANDVVIDFTAILAAGA